MSGIDEISINIRSAIASKTAFGGKRKKFLPKIRMAMERASRRAEAVRKPIYWPADIRAVRGEAIFANPDMEVIEIIRQSPGRQIEKSFQIRKHISRAKIRAIAKKNHPLAKRNVF
jgi:hypothetical protein